MRTEILTYILKYAIIAAAVVGIIGVPTEYLIGYLRERKAYRKAHEDIELNIRVWTSIAASCDPVEDTYDKGYAIARLVIYHHELEELENNRKRDLCS